VEVLEPLAIHPATRAILVKLQANLPQSLLLSGQEGVGLYTIAKRLSPAAIAAILSPHDSKGTPDKNGTINVEMIRQLYEQTRAKQTARQIVIIDDAERMSHGAQSAFLKLLEEPGLHTSFILTSHAPESLLPTVRSRVQHIVIQPLPAQQTKEFITGLNITDPTKHTQLLYLASGLPAELVRLTSDVEAFATRAAIVGDARALLQGTAYEKSLVVQKYKSNRTGALELIDSATAMLRRTLSSKPQQSLVSQLEQLLGIRERIASNYNISLQLMQFVL